MFRKLFCFICLVLFNTNVQAITFEQYIVDHESDEMRSYLIGYADAIHNNSFLIGGCPRKLTYRPYGEYFQHIDIYISKKTKDKSVNLNAFYQEPVEPLLTAVILKYINCNNPESRQLSNEPKRVQIEMRNLARNIMQQTQKYQTPEEREKEFMYKEYIDRLDNPKKYEKAPQKPVTKPKAQTRKETPKILPKPIPMPQQESKPVAQPPLQQPVIPAEEKQEKNRWYNISKKDRTEENDIPSPTKEPNMDNQILRIEPNITNNKTLNKPTDSTIPTPITDPIVVIQKPLIDNTTQPPIASPSVNVTQETKVENTNEKPNAQTKPGEITTNEKKEAPKEDSNQKTPVEEKPKKPDNNYTLKSDDPFTMPEVEIPAQIVKKNIKEVDITDVQAKKYELESLNINLDNIDNVTLPSL